MKKNILAIAILAATLVNLTLVAIMLFTLNPYVKRANELITRVCQVIDLELESPNPNGEKDVVPIEDRDLIVIISEGSCSLKKGPDGKAAYAQISATISANKKHEDYEKKKDLIEANKATIENYIKTELVRYTADDLLIPENLEEVNKAVLFKVQELFKSKFIYEVTVSQPVVQ